MEIQNPKGHRHHIPIFPLGLVLLPHMTMPLHIFEERYKTMVHECLERNEPFGIVYFDGRQIHKVGCTARIVEVLKHYEDVRMDIVVQGGMRFYMDQTDDSRDCLTADVFYIGDMEESVRDEDKERVHKTADLLRHLHDLSGSTGEDDRFDDVDLQRLSFIVPGSEGFTMEERQQFLEMTSARERLKKGLRILERVIARVKINQEVTEIIGGNGHVRAYLAEKGVVS